MYINKQQGKTIETWCTLMCMSTCTVLSLSALLYRDSSSSKPLSWHICQSSSEVYRCTACAAKLSASVAVHNPPQFLP